MLSCTVNLGLLNQTELHRGHGALGFCHEVNVLYGAFVECNRPIRVILTNRSGDVESIRQLHIHGNILIGIKVGCEVMLVGRVVNDMVIQVAGRLHCVHAQLTLDGRLGKDIHTVTLIQNIVGNMLNDCGSLFIVDKGSSLDDEFFRVVLELIEYGWLNALQNGDDSLTGNSSFIHQFADQVIFYIAACVDGSTVSAGFFFHKRCAAFVGNE